MALRFTATTGTNAAGTASVVHLKGQTQSYIVSARHLLGPEGGFPKQTAAKDVPSVVQAIAIDSFSGGHHRYDVTGLAVPTERLKADGGMPTDDMAIYLNHDNSPQGPRRCHWPIILPAMGATAPGSSPTSVAACRKARSSSPAKSSGCSVTAGASCSSTTIRSSPPAPVVRPCVNAAGEVVGVYSGHSNANGHV